MKKNDDQKFLCFPQFISKDVFVENDNYNLRSGAHIASKTICITIVSNLVTKIWNLVPKKMKNALSLNGRTWNPKNALD